MDIKKAQNDFNTFQAVQMFNRYKVPQKAKKSLKRSRTIIHNVYSFGLNPFVSFVRFSFGRLDIPLPGQINDNF